MLAVIVSLIPAGLGLTLAIGLGRVFERGDKKGTGRGLAASFGLIVLALIVARYA